MVGLPDVGKSFRICLFIVTEYMNVTDGRTDNAQWHRLRLDTASRGNTDPAVLVTEPGMGLGWTIQ